jgi:hypothetical protein
MLDAGGSGGGSGTNWNGADITAIWAALINQDTTPHWKMLSGWQTSYELTWQHLSDVKRYRENLATAWPPEKSPAAAAYVERLDQLIDHLQGTYDAAVANHTAFSAATVALADTRRKVEALYNEYIANRGKIAAFKESMATPSGGLAGQAARNNAKPPVTDERQAQITWEARSLMFGLSSEITQARTSLTRPPRFDAGTVVDGGGKDQGGATYVPPVLPPLFHGDSGSGSSRISGGGAGRQVSPAPSFSGANPGSGSTIGQPGLVLGGAPTPVVQPPTIGGGAVPQTPISHTPSGMIHPPMNVPGNLSGGPSSPTSGFVPGRMPGADGSIKPAASGTPNGAVRSMPPGGIIGGMPGAGLGQPGGNARAAQRINPIGGIISPAMASRSGSVSPAGTGARPGMPIGGVAGAIGGRPVGHRGESDTASRWDPENPWETDEGVAPIVLPPQEQRVDPGPAIGLLK